MPLDNYATELLTLPRFVSNRRTPILPLTINDLLLAAPHHMDVLDPNELQFDVGVVVLILVAFSCGFICHGIQLDTNRKQMNEAFLTR